MEKTVLINVDNFYCTITKIIRYYFIYNTHQIFNISYLNSIIC